MRYIYIKNYNNIFRDLQPNLEDAAIFLCFCQNMAIFLRLCLKSLFIPRKLNICSFAPSFASQSKDCCFNTHILFTLQTHTHTHKTGLSKDKRFVG